MEILQFLTSFFANDKNMKILKPIIDLLAQNSFDIKKTLASLNPEMLRPIVKEFMSNMNNRPTTFVERDAGLVPISNIADKDIVYALNRYLGQE